MLEKQRNKIDEIDKQLVSLFEERMDLVTEIANIKKINKLNVYDSHREQAVINKVLQHLNNQEYELSLTAFFESLMKITKDHQNSVIDK